MTKKYILWAGLIGVAFLLLGFALHSSSCFHDALCREISDYFEPVFDNIFSVGIMMGTLFALPLFFLFLLTYRLHDSVFRAWWNFARWFAPIIVVVTLLLEGMGSGGGMGIGGAISSGFNIFVISILYVILIGVSLWKIFRANRRLEKR